MLKNFLFKLKLAWRILTEKQLYRIYFYKNEEEIGVCQSEILNDDPNIDQLIMSHLISRTEGVAFDIGVYETPESGEEEYAVIMRSIKSGWHLPIKLFKHRQPKKALQAAKDLLYKLNYNYG